jgi:hypothetical protein
VIIGGLISYYRIYETRGDLARATELAYLGFINLGCFLSILIGFEIAHRYKKRHIKEFEPHFDQRNFHEFQDKAIIHEEVREGQAQKKGQEEVAVVAHNLERYENSEISVKDGFVISFAEFCRRINEGE